MRNEILYSSVYEGTKHFTQQDINTANATGFGAAADDYAERGIDLNEQLIMNKPATFFYRINNNSMSQSGIQAGDVLIVDRSIQPDNGKIIIAALNGEILIGRFHSSFNKIMLTADNKSCPNIQVNECMQFESLGVVTCVIHLLEPKLITFSKTSKKNSNNHH
jgi:DNA polymerase V